MGADEARVTVPLYPALFGGLGLVAAWLYVRFPARRPATLRRAMTHVVLAMAVLSVLPAVLDLYFEVLSGKIAAAAFVTAAVMPALCYVLLSWFWLLSRVAHELGPRNPRGGHPVADGA